MALLDKKVPPLVVAGIAAVGIWVLSVALPGADLPHWFRLYGSLLFLILGASVCIAGVVEFRRVQTTVDPRKPESSSSLVTSGVYTVTRNPMYLGFAFLLLALALYLASYWSLLIVAGFVIYLDQFQIRPEEKALAETFGQAFRNYQARVRRWI